RQVPRGRNESGQDEADDEERGENERRQRDHAGVIGGRWARSARLHAIKILHARRRAAPAVPPSVSVVVPTYSRSRTETCIRNRPSTIRLTRTPRKPAPGLETRLAGQEIDPKWLVGPGGPPIIRSLAPPVGPNREGCATNDYVLASPCEEGCKGTARREARASRGPVDQMPNLFRHHLPDRAREKPVGVRPLQLPLLDRRPSIRRIAQRSGFLRRDVA